MIILGYPGIGKTTLAQQKEYCVDLDIMAGAIPNDELWFIKEYCELAHKLSLLGYTVLVPTDSSVRKYISEHSFGNCYLIYPTKDLKDSWLKKLQAAYYIHRTSLKAQLTLENCTEHFDEDIESLESDNYFKRYPLTDENYSLPDIVDNLSLGERKPNVPPTV